MPSSSQVIPTVLIFDYEEGLDGRPIVGETVRVQLEPINSSLVTPAVMLVPKIQEVVTDGNGYWQMAVISNAIISPANSFYTVNTDYRSYEIQLDGIVGPYQSSTKIINAPVNLPIATTALAGPLTVAGLLTAQAGLTVSGAVSLPAGSLALADITPLPAQDALAAHLAGVEAFTGIKTFTANPVFNAASIPIADITPAPATDTLAAHLAGVEAFTGIKTFTANPVFNAAAIPNSALAASPTSDRHNINVALHSIGSPVGPVEIDSGMRCTVVVPASGRVRVTASINWKVDAASDVSMHVQPAAIGWTKMGGQTLSSASAINFSYGACSGGVILSGLTPGSTVFQMGWQNGGGNLTSDGNSLGVRDGTWFMVETQP